MFPWRCILCGSRSKQKQDLCHYCEQSLAWMPAHCCVTCARILPEGQSSCGACIQALPFIDRCISLWAYDTVSQHFVQQLKFNQKLIYARIMGELISKHIPGRYQNEPMPEVIIPVPLHRKRLLTRGFNQALEIAKVVAKALSIPCRFDLCHKVRHTTPQVALSAQNRKKNVKNTFSARPMSYEHVVIIDDVVTTLSTVNELAKTLKNIGVKRVDVWSCARA